MIDDPKSLGLIDECLSEIALLLESGGEPTAQHYDFLAHDPEIGLLLVEKLGALEERTVDENDAYYSACLFALELCISQLQMTAENGNKRAEKQLNQLMHQMAKTVTQKKQSLGFWLPVLNGFYDAQVSLSESLKIAYYVLATDNIEGTEEDNDTLSHLSSMRELIQSLAPMTSFEIASHFFSQSYAMPPEFFADLMADLLDLDEGKDIAVLMLMHPAPEIREELMSMFDAYIPNITLSRVSLNRLKMMKTYFPEKQQSTFDHWIKIQRKKEVAFLPQLVEWSIQKIVATEVDGSGSQGLFFHLKKNRKMRLCGILCKLEKGIKEVWITPPISQIELKQYYKDAFDGNVMLRELNEDYVQEIIPHFLEETLAKSSMPGLNFIELQEVSGVIFFPKKLDINHWIQILSVQIQPFTPETIQKSLKRSHSWLKTKRFVSSWFIESPRVDKIVNEYSGFEEGIKVCRFEKAVDAVLEALFENQRPRWLFHFLWSALWLKTKASPQHHTWEDCFIIAYLIYNHEPLNNISLLYAMCSQSVVHSIETMCERQTHLHQA